MELGEKFWSRVDKTDTCWVWTAGKTRKYGSFKFNGRAWRVHRLVWESIHGPIPDGMVICHKCDNPPCCNPDHLFIGTQKDNIQDALRKGRYNVNQNHAYGDKLPHTKLTETDVKVIRELAAQGCSHVALAKKYKVDPSSIWQAVKRMTWKHVA